MSLPPTSESAQNWDRGGLPKWSYHSEEMLEAEKDLLFRRHWQLVCHETDIPGAGDFITLDMVGERVLVVRGKDMVVRAFHNLCRHRGSRVVAGSEGTCKNAITCPFHGWVYNLDGSLRGVAQPQSFPNLDREKYGLKPVELDIWRGFVFVRFLPGPQGSLADVMQDVDDEIEQYKLEDLRPAEPEISTSEVNANWKCVRDVDNEGYHVPMAHPGLQDLFGDNYYDAAWTQNTVRSVGGFREGDGRLWSVRNYKKILQAPDRLDADHKNAWLYVGVFPNLVFGFYPDSVIFYQEFPTAVGKTIQRFGNYRYKDEDRRMKLARYLSMRIDRITSKEDEQLIEWTWEAAFSSGFDGIVLSDLEFGVHCYHEVLRKIFPVLNNPEPPPGKLVEINTSLLEGRPE